MEPAYWRDLLRPTFAGRKIILTGMPVAGSGPMVVALRKLGAGALLVLGEGMGTGELPDCEWFELDISADSLLDGIRQAKRILTNLPADARAAVERFDPDGTALVVGTFLNELAEVAERPNLAWRRPAWIALEDKVVVDALWDDIGIARAPSRVVAVDDLADEAGVVWAGDAREGFHGGAELTRWIRTEDDAVAAREEMKAHCDTARVMPFLEGIPCSIHGVVFPDYVAALRPVEMVTLRRGSTFFYAGAATYWDPPEADRDTLRDIARRVGTELRRRVDFRGAFTVDGVLTADGFRPTELNPRMGAGLAQIARGAPKIPLDLLNQALVAGLDLEYKAEAFESLVVDTADACRAGGTWKMVDTPFAQATVPMAWTGDTWRLATAHETADATLMTGPSNLGGFLRLTLEPARTPAGPSVGERAVAFWAFCDRELGTRIGPLEAAPDVRA